MITQEYLDSVITTLEKLAATLRLDLEKPDVDDKETCSCCIDQQEKDLEKWQRVYELVNSHEKAALQLWAIFSDVEVHGDLPELANFENLLMFTLALQNIDLSNPVKLPFYFVLMFAWLKTEADAIVSEHDAKNEQRRLQNELEKAERTIATYVHTFGDIENRHNYSPQDTAEIRFWKNAVEEFIKLKTPVHLSPYFFSRPPE